MSYRRPDYGKCSVCGFATRVQVNGLLMKHTLFCGQDRNQSPCEGSGKPPKETNKIIRGYILVDPNNTRVHSGYFFENRESAMKRAEANWKLKMVVPVEIHYTMPSRTEQPKKGSGA